MPTQKELRVGSIVECRNCVGIVVAVAGPAAHRRHDVVASADVYYFKEKYIDWEYIRDLEVLVS